MATLVVDPAALASAVAFVAGVDTGDIGRPNAKRADEITLVPEKPAGVSLAPRIVVAAPTDSILTLDTFANDFYGCLQERSPLAPQRTRVVTHTRARITAAEARACTHRDASACSRSPAFPAKDDWP